MNDADAIATDSAGGREVQVVFGKSRSGAGGGTSEIVASGLTQQGTLRDAPRRNLLIFTFIVRLERPPVSLPCRVYDLGG